MMNFWVREKGAPPFHGPFSLGEVAAALKAGRFSAACELLEAAGQSYGALKRATGWRSVRDFFHLPDVPAAGPILAKPGQGVPSPGTTAPGFPVAVALVGLFRALAVIVGLLWLLVVALSWGAAAKLGSAGWASLLLQVLYGVGSVALLLAVGEGLNLAIAIEANTRRRAPSPSGEGQRPGEPLPGPPAGSVPPGDRD
jgi:hypothetical protein